MIMKPEGDATVDAAERISYCYEGGAHKKVVEGSRVLEPVKCQHNAAGRKIQSPLAEKARMGYTKIGS